MCRVGKTDERVDELNDDYGTQDVIIALHANGGTRGELEWRRGDEEVHYSTSGDRDQLFVFMRIL